MFLAKFRRAAGTLCTGWQEFFGRMLIPGVCAFFLKPFNNVAQRGIVLESRFAALAEKHDDRYAPKTLARDAPVGALFDHFVNTFFTPPGNPLDVLNLGQRFSSQRILAVSRNGVHADEPLHGCTENYRIVAAPAMRIAVLVSMVAKQSAAIGKQLYDNRVCCKDVLAFVFWQTLGVNAF